MTLSGEYEAVLDRIEEGLAVILVDDEDVREEFVVPVETLPADARRDGSVLTISVEEGELVDVEYRADETADRKRTLRERFDDLARRPPGSDDEER